MKTLIRMKLRAARKELGLSVEQVAQKVNLSASFYYKIEQGHRNPGIEDAKKIADLLGSTVDELFFASLLDESSSVVINTPEMSKAV